MKNILIIQPFHSGHRFALYVNAAIKVASDLDLEFKILTAKFPDKEVINTIKHHAGVEKKILVFDYQALNMGCFSNIRNKFSLYFAIRKFLKDYPLSHDTIIWIPNIEDIDIPFALDISSKNYFRNLHGLHMTIDFHRRSYVKNPKTLRNFIKKIILLIMLKKIETKKIAILDESFFKLDWNFKQLIINTNKLKYLPDFGEVINIKGSNAAFNFQISNEKTFNVLLYGSISRRKGIYELIEAISELKEHNILFIVAGKIHDDAIDVMESHKTNQLVKEGKILVINEFISPEKEIQLFNEANLVSVIYQRNFTGSSGVLYQAASLGIPVISDSYGLIGWTVKQHDIGPICNITDASSIAKSIEDIYHDHSKYEAYSENAKRLAKYHSYSTHIKTLNSIFEIRS